MLYIDFNEANDYTKVCDIGFILKFKVLGISKTYYFYIMHFLTSGNVVLEKDDRDVLIISPSHTFFMKTTKNFDIQLKSYYSKIHNIYDFYMFIHLENYFYELVISYNFDDIKIFF